MAKLDWESIDRDRLLIRQAIEQKKAELLNVMYSLDCASGLDEDGSNYHTWFDEQLQKMRESGEAHLWLLAEFAWLGSLVATESIDEDWEPRDIAGEMGLA